MSEQVRVVLVTVPEAALAESLARGLVEARLAACVNVIPGVVSHYRWEGALHKDSETLLVIKTSAGALPELTRFVRERHTADLPEILALPAPDGDSRYLDWVLASTSPEKA